jgi:pimeloyl-ACP methyl ester carboxylesterase
MTLNKLSWDHAFLDSNELRLHYYRTGGNKPPVVLNHGATDDGLCWTRLALALEADYDLIMVDARGHGLSQSGAGDYSPRARAADLAGLIQTLDLDKPVVGGHSLGADTSLHLAVHYPHLTRGIFLEDPPIPPPGEPLFGGEMGETFSESAKTFVRIMQLVKVLPAFMGRFLARRMMPGAPDEEILPWVASKKRLNRDFFRVEDQGAVLNPDFSRALFKEIEVPILLVLGDRELGSIVSQETAHNLSALARDLRIAHLAGANHDIRRARFDPYIQALKEFLATCYK